MALSSKRNLSTPLFPDGEGIGLREGLYPFLIDQQTLGGDEIEGIDSVVIDGQQLFLKAIERRARQAMQLVIKAAQIDGLSRDKSLMRDQLAPQVGAGVPTFW